MITLEEFIIEDIDRNLRNIKSDLLSLYKIKNPNTFDAKIFFEIDKIFAQTDDILNNIMIDKSKE